MNEAKTIEELHVAIAALENQRSILGDAVVDTALEPLFEKLAALESTKQPSEKRKQATILFADVAGFTALSETMDAEQVVELINVLWSRLDAIIIAHGGRIDKHMGDAVMALWGAETAREDDPERAIHAALDMQSVLANFSFTAPDRTLHIRIGINTGSVLIGRVGSTSEFTAMGDTVNLASRLQNLCPLDGVLISHDTYRHVRGVFDVQRLEPVAVKGKSQPVLTYLVLRAKPRAFRMATRGIEGIETRMVGRAAELLSLQNAFLHVQSSNAAQVVTIIGEAGVGKSRLLYEFDNWIELRPEPVIYFKGRNTPVQQRQPFALMRDLFSFRFEILESDDLETAMHKFRAGMGTLMPPDRADIIGHWLGFDFSSSPNVAALLGADEFADLARAYLDQYLQKLAEENSILLLLEDIHWADNPSLNLILHLCEELVDSGLLIICLARPSLFERRPQWGQERANFTRVDLQPLTPSFGAELVDEILQKVDHIPVDLRDLIVNTAEGNPFFVEELIKSLIDQGVIQRGEGRWRVAETQLQNAYVPPTLTALLQARLDSLSSHERDILQCASVVGRLFWDKPVADLADCETSEIDPALQTMRRREFIFHRRRSTLSGAREYIFKHALLRDVAYETVLLKLRRTYHARVARWLETNVGDRLTEFSGLIAEHYTQAKDFDHASAYWERAGDAALKTGDALSSRDAFDLALEMASSASDSPPDPGLSLKLGRSLMQLGEFDRAVTVLEDTRRLSIEMKAFPLHVDTLVEMYWMAARLGYSTDAEKYLAGALPMARDIGGKTLLRTLLAASHYEYYRPNHAQAKTLIEESLVLARHLQDVTFEATALNDMSIQALLTGDLDAATHGFEQSKALAIQVGNRFLEQRATLNLGNVSYESEDYAAAKRYYQDALAICRDMNLRTAEAGGLTNLAFSELALGEYEAAWRTTRKALVQSVKLSLTPIVMYALLLFGQLYVKRNDLRTGLAIIGLVREHQATNPDTHRDIDRFLGELDLDETEITHLLAGGANLDLDKVIADLLDR